MSGEPEDDAATPSTPSTPSMRWGAASHAGLVRTENEDAFVAEPRVFAVADGMGGHQAGEVASALAVETMRDRLGDGVASVDVVIASVVEANAAIFQAAHRNAAQQGMGTTLTGIAVLSATDEHPETLALVNVGDSRTYRVRNGKLERVTIDHSYVQELVSTGHISEMEARTHPRRNIVTRALGIEPIVRVDSWVLSMVKGDRFVLCSDGLVDEVPDHEIEVVAAGVADPQAAADELVAMANRHGGRDNVTVLVVDVLRGLEVPPEPLTVTPSAAASLGDTATVPVVRDEHSVSSAIADAFAGDRGATATDNAATTMIPAVGETAAGGATAATPTGAGEDGAAAETADATNVATDASAADATVPTPHLPSASAGDPPTAQLSTTGTTSTPSEPPKPKRRFTGGMFLFFLALALILTVTITLVAVSLSGDDEPTDTPDDTTPTTEVEATEPDATPVTTTRDTVGATLPPTTLPPSVSDAGGTGTTGPPRP